MSEVLIASSNLQEFAKAFTRAVWIDHFGAEMVCDKIFEIEAPRADEVRIPFAIRLLEAEPMGNNLGI